MQKTINQIKLAATLAWRSIETRLVQSGATVLVVGLALAADDRAELTIPIAMADNVGGARLIGTTTDFFQLQPAIQAASPFQISEGKFFEDLPINEEVTYQENVPAVEAVLGYQAAQDLGLTIGDGFVSNHGTSTLLNSEVHDLLHVVVGILDQTNTAFDSSVFVPLSSV